MPIPGALRNRISTPRPSPGGKDGDRHIPATGRLLRAYARRWMGVIELTDVAYALPGGWTLFEGVTFRVPEGEHAALVGANGIGKTTLLRLIAGEEKPLGGAVRIDGRAGLMRQFIGSSERPTTRARLPARLQRTAGREAAAPGARAEERLAADPTSARSSPTRTRSPRGSRPAGTAPRCSGTRARTWRSAAAIPRARTGRSRRSPGESASGWRSRSCSRSPFDVVLLDEPDNTLDIAGKEWLEATIAADPRTILFVSHDRTVLDRAATRIVTLEGARAWTHAGGSRPTPRPVTPGSSGWTSGIAGTRRNGTADRRW